MIAEQLFIDLRVICFQSLEADKNLFRWRAVGVIVKGAAKTGNRWSNKKADQ
ncbi:MAG: hypothetical protein ACRD63_05860 [Pyrinomonadaceae bacterium]